MTITDSGFMLGSLEFLATLFIFFVGLCTLAIVVVYVLDVTQTKHALRRNYTRLSVTSAIFSKK